VIVPSKISILLDIQFGINNLHLYYFIILKTILISIFTYNMLHISEMSLTGTVDINLSATYVCQKQVENIQSLVKYGKKY